MKLAGLLIGLCLILAGCGYHLRGSTLQLDSQATVQLQNISAPDAYQQLHQALSRSGIVLVSAQPDYRIQLINEQVNQRVAAIARDGLAQDYEVQYQLVYRLDTLNDQASDNEQSNSDTQVIALTREYAYDRVTVLGNSDQQRILVDGMRNDAINSLLRRLQAKLASDIDDQ